MKEYIYVRAEVMPCDTGSASLLNTLAEAVAGPQPDVIPDMHAGDISFRHCRLIAEDDDDAYARGWPLLGEPREGAVCNDYVVCLG
jgi:hypothetical protein